MEYIFPRAYFSTDFSFGDFLFIYFFFRAIRYSLFLKFSTPFEIERLHILLYNEKIY